MVDPIRVVVQQPALPKYRIPVFRELAARQGIELCVAYAAARNLSNADPDGFVAHYEPMRRVGTGRHQFLWHPTQWRYASRRYADVLILSWDAHYLTLLPALLKARWNGVPTILWGHGYSKNESRLRSWVRQAVGRLGAALLLYNHTTAERLINEGGFDRSRVFVALNALDQSGIQQNREWWLSRPDELAAFRQRRRLCPGRVILFVSRLERENGVDLLLRATANLRDVFPEIRTVIIGKGPDEPRLQALAGQLNLRDAVSFVGAVYEEHQLAPWFLCSDVFCYPQNIGLSILHAFGYGLPVVTSDRIEGQNPEIEAFRDGVNGRLYRHGDAEALTATLRGLLQSPETRDAMAAEAHRTATQRFTLENMVDGFEDAIRFCAGRPRLRRSEVLDVAIIANANAPYRLHYHRRIAAEVPEIRLWSFFTHETSGVPWSLAAPESIRPVLFGQGESTTRQSDPSRIRHEWRKGGRIIKELIRQNVRAVVLLGYNDPGRLRIINWCYKSKIPCFVWGDSNIRGDNAEGLKRWFKRRLLHRVIGRATGVMYCGSLGKAYFERYGLRPGRGFLCTLEPDYQLIQSVDPAALRAVLATWSLRQERRRIIYSGRLAAVKRVDLLIDAFATIAADRPLWDLVIAGDGPLKTLLQARLPEQLRGRVTWTGFIDDQAKLGALYRACDVLILPSDFEPWALVINEAAAAGLAIVASDVVGAAAELVRDGVNGRIFPKGDLAALTECLLDVTDPAKIDAMKAASPLILAEWRRVADPVEGFRQAMRFCGVLPPLGPETAVKPPAEGLARAMQPAGG